jgi:hypothetical protein
MLSLVSKVEGWIIAAVMAALSIVGIYLKGRASGKEAVKKEVAKDRLEKEIEKNEVIVKTSEVAAGVASQPSSTVQSRLQDRWSRD